MKIRNWLILIVLSFSVGAAVWYAINVLQSTRSGISQLLTKTDEMLVSTEPKTLPELIAEQIESGIVTCPKVDLLTYEACLLFQGALGTWQRVGLRDECPDVIDSSSTPPSEPKRKNVRNKSKKTNVRLEREDALRASNTPCFGYIYAINVANTTPILVSTANRTFHLATESNSPNPGSDPELCLSVRHGICGNHTAVAIGFFERAGFKVRPVEFYYEYNGARLSHIIPEVLIDGRWRLIDSTYGAYWIDKRPSVPFELMTTERVLARKPRLKYYNSALLPFGFRSAIQKTNYFSYISEEADVIRGGSGEITLELKGAKGTENFLHKPNFVGDNRPDGQAGGVQFRFISKSTNYELVINVLAASISDSEAAFICIDELCKKYSEEKQKYRFVVQKPSKLHLKTNTDVGYIVMKSLNWKLISS